MGRVIVVGGGPAGMMAAGQCALDGDTRVTLVEKNSKLGKKLLITGKGRCNFTNVTPLQEFVDNMPGNGHFLFSSLHAFDTRDLRSFFLRYGVPSKVERGGRVFPASDAAGDIVEALEAFLKEAGVRIIYNEKVKKILTKEGSVAGIETEKGTLIEGEKVILATGGASYPTTGSTGDGYKLAAEVGHSLIPPRPGLIPCNIKEEWVKKLQGLALKNIRLTVFAGGKKKDSGFGELLFTHFGISGPIVLTLSRNLLSHVDKGRKITFSLNLKPALTEEKLLRRIQRDFDDNSKKQFKNILQGLLPQKMIPVMVELSGISEEKMAAQITKKERLGLAKMLQNLEMTLDSLRPLREAIVTVGGVAVKEINPRTMESKLVKGLFFCGEVMNIDGYTGGFNLQAAFSTGYVAGKNASPIHA